jgi:ubiquitin-protein ligase
MPIVPELSSTEPIVQRGPPDSPYAGGEYHGVLLFPSEYPFKPPGIKMYTPSGRFQQDKRICMSMSDFHPGSVRTSLFSLHDLSHARLGSGTRHGV